MSEKQLLNVKNLYVDVEEKQILHGVDLLIGKVRHTFSWDQTEQVNQHLAMLSWEIQDIP